MGSKLVAEYWIREDQYRKAILTFNPDLHHTISNYKVGMPVEADDNFRGCLKSSGR